MLIPAGAVLNIILIWEDIVLIHTVSIIDCHVCILFGYSGICEKK